MADDLPITDIDVRVNITHSYVEDITMTLIAPGEKKLFYSQSRGSANNFTDTDFDSEASVSIQSGSAPFNGTFRPLESLSSLYGTSGRGTWQLKVSDNASQDTGTINSSCLIYVLMVK